MKRFATLFMLLLFLALSAQSWSAPQVTRRGEIIRAEYGYGNRWTDVSQRVFSLARGEVLSFRADDATLGVTTRRGAESSLRIFVRARDGQTRQLTFRENQYVNLRGYAFRRAAFGTLRITDARYGTSVRSSDVTDRLTSQIRDGRLSMVVNNTTMGGDPDHDRPKTLTVNYTLDGRANQISVAEGGSLNLPSDAGYNQYDLRITSARYGTSVRSSDVTDRLTSQISGGRLSMLVNNTTMGGDPDHDRPKTLTVSYTLGGRANQISVAEGGYLNLPGDVGYNQYDLRITSARYGTSASSNDVTNRLNSQIRDGKLSLQVTNDTMGGDPDRNRPKTLTISYTSNGREDQVSVAEGEFLNLPFDSGNNRYGLRITSARYGTSIRSNDVTNRLNSQVRDGQLSLQVTNDTMGGDPDPNRAKTLTVSYNSNGREDQVSVAEGGYLNLPGDSGYNRYGLRITSARYGTSVRSSDVTDRLISQIRDGRLSMQVNNTTMGGDPDHDRAKTLTVNYTVDGRADQVSVAEGGYLNLPSGTGVGSYDLRISRARYGTSNRSNDVTDRLTSQIRNGQLNLQVNNDTMGGDPDRDRPKTLTVSYTLDGRADQVVVNEGEYLRLPAGYGTTASQTVRCESVNNRRNYCSADTRGGVRLTRQLGSTDCVRGSSWDIEQNRIWVDNGCRADFEVLSQGGSSWSQRLISSGTQLSIRTNEMIDSKTAREGQRYSGVVEADVLDNTGSLAIPKGSDVELVIRSTEGSDLVLDVDSIIVSGRRYNVSTEDMERKGREGIGANKRTATMVGGGAAIGAIIGAIVGGGKGAAIGAAIGAAGGAGAQVLTKGKEVNVPSETVLNFRLEQDLYLVPQP